MRRSVIGCLLLALATTVSAQHYDPYYVSPGPKGRIAADLGLFADDVSRIADASSTITAGKLSISDEWEVGLAADLGLLRDHAGTLSSVQVGTKLGLDEHMALTGAAVLPLGETDDLGLSVGLMKTFLAGQHMVNTWTSAALLDGYTGKGRRPLRADRAHTQCGRSDHGISRRKRTIEYGSPGDELGIDVGPNVDINWNQTATINTGLSFGVAGDAKQDDLAFTLSLLMAY
ncbi:MAG TPA: hypothetical protein QF604_01035 [Candidatus Latescibacteria bacterium]|nr:hypothetical protein [Gemmatimonadota bacterium]MDP7363653.1 hypothetical protein [Candidatus Latescibacterota bacterium]MDP7633389.1 hypothetical protein [Candidatus Latescibacterota bacterium]HCV25005.1 hypothetical protein [Candidatus Latescibacterota bacterium]HJN26479.1 hypothetical protein [Candidatus Latescibacterota bacterium]